MIDCHFHLSTSDTSTPEKRAERADMVREAAEELGVERVCLIGRRGGSVEECREHNRTVGKMVEEHPDIFYGWARANPLWGEEGVQEFRRAVEEDGLIGLKLYAQAFLDDPEVEPLAEAAVDMDVPIISHVAHRHERIDRKPLESNSDNVRALAEKFPDLKLISGHIGGGGVWEYRLKNVRDLDNVYMDTSGSVTDAGQLEMAVEYLGADRLVYGTDTWFRSGFGKLSGCDLTPEQKAKIGYNMESLIHERVPNKLSEDEVTAGIERATEQFEEMAGPREEEIVDANAFVGHFPFRQVDASPEGVIAEMDRVGVDRALVSSMHSIMYRNPQPGNEELAEAVDGHDDRLVPLATIDPTYPAWEEDFETCLSDLGMRGAKLLPAHHDYDLDDPGVAALFDACAAADVPAVVAGPLEDQRGRHPRVELRNFEGNDGKKRWDPDQVGDLISSLRASPDADVVVTNVGLSGAEEIVRETTESYESSHRLRNFVRDGETLFVVDDMRNWWPNDAGRIVEDLGTDHLVSGPRLPMRVFDSHHHARYLPVSEAEKDAVRSRNLLSLFE